MDPAWVLAAESLVSEQDSIDGSSSAASFWCWSTESPSARSPAQEALRIPISVIVLAGLVETVTAKSLSPAAAAVLQQQQLFERLQTLYQHSKAQPQAQQQRSLLLFRWSPRLRPTPEWQAVIDSVVAQRKLELELRAAQVTRELLLLNHNTNGSSNQQTKTNCQRIIRTQANSHRDKSNPVRPLLVADQRLEEKEEDEEEHVDQDADQDSDDEDDALAVTIVITANGVDENQRPSHSRDVVDENENDDKDWTPVQRRNLKHPTTTTTTTPSATTARTATAARNESRHTPTNPLGPPTPDPKCWLQPTNQNGCSHTHIPKNNAASQIGSGSPQDEMIAVVTSSTLSDNDNTAGMDATPSSNSRTEKVPIPSYDCDIATVGTVAPLTLDGISPSLTLCNQQSPSFSSGTDNTTTTTATANTSVADNEAALVVALRRQWQKERHDHEAAVQALQLRLYIAETRLKTYEEALAEHNRVVSDNIAAVDRTTPEQRTGSREVSRVWRNQIE